MSSWYERHVLPYAIDIACGVKPIRRQREKIVPLARGHVLEVGFGTGRNLAYYDKARVERLVGLDPALEMHRLAKKRMERAGLSVELVALAAEQIPFDAGTFDSVVCTYTLCSVPDPIAALKEMRRVLKPGAPLLFCEHGLAPDASVQRWQYRLNPLWSKLGGGCQLTRDIARLLREAGLQSRDLQTMYLPGPRALSYNYWGTATG